MNTPLEQNGLDLIEILQTAQSLPEYIDLSEDTAVESDVAEGKTFHKADGTAAVGTAAGGGTSEDFKQWDMVLTQTATGHFNAVEGDEWIAKHYNDTRLRIAIIPNSPISAAGANYFYVWLGTNIKFTPLNESQLTLYVTKSGGVQSLRPPDTISTHTDFQHYGGIGVNSNGNIRVGATTLIVVPAGSYKITAWL